MIEPQRKGKASVATVSGGVKSADKLEGSLMNFGLRRVLAFALFFELLFPPWRILEA